MYNNIRHLYLKIRHVTFSYCPRNNLVTLSRGVSEHEQKKRAAGATLSEFTLRVLSELHTCDGIEFTVTKDIELPINEQFGCYLLHRCVLNTSRSSTR